MRVLGIESATTSVGAALIVDGVVVAEAEVRDTRRHTEHLLELVGEVLRAAPFELDAIEVLSCDVGPGLFTGLRVGIATTAGLAMALGRSVVEVSSLEALAHAASAAGLVGSCTAVVDARRGEVFLQRFELGPNPVALGEAEVCAPEVMAARVGAGQAVGDGVERYRSLLGGAQVDLVLSHPSAASVGLVASAKLATGVSPIDAAQLRPRYLRAADAVPNFAEREVAR